MSRPSEQQGRILIPRGIQEYRPLPLNRMHSMSQSPSQSPSKNPLYRLAEPNPSIAAVSLSTVRSMCWILSCAHTMEPERWLVTASELRWNEGLPGQRGRA